MGARPPPRAGSPAPKLRPPGLAGRSVARRHLDAELGDDDAWTQAPVLLMSAGVGAGKTTLLSAWAAHRGSVAWVTLDRRDDDPATLWRAVLEALLTTGAWREDSGLADLRAPHAELGPDFVWRVMSEVATVDGPVWLVLDDVHEVSSAAALDTLDLLLRLRPDALRVVLASRYDPPLAQLHQLRLAGRLREIRSDDLRFDTHEAAALLASHGIELSGDELAALLERVEGWAAGLRLAALMLVDAADPSAAIRDVSGDSRAVADYLVTAVLSAMDDGERDLLLHSSVCEQVTADLAATLTGRADAGMVLERLARANGLVCVQHSSERWYRCHALLRGYLLAELARRDRTAAPRLRGVAAGWFESRGLPATAVEHAVAAGDGGLLVRLLRDHGLRLLLDGHGGRLRQLLAAVHDDVLHRHADAALIAAAADLDDGEAVRAGLHLDVAAKLAEDDPRQVALLATLRVWSQRLAGEVGDAVGELGRAGAVDSDDGDVAVLALAERGMAHVLVGDHARAVVDLTEAHARAAAVGRDYLALVCRSLLGLVHADRGDLRRMRGHVQAAIDLAGRRGWLHTTAAAWAHLLTAWSCIHSLDFEGAAAALQAVERSTRAGADVPLQLSQQLMASVVGFAAGTERRDQLQRYRRAWEEVGDGRWLRPIAANAAQVELRMCLQLGERLWAAQAVERVTRQSPGTAEAAVAAAVLAAHSGQRQRARMLLAAAEDPATPRTVLTTDVEIRLLECELEVRAGRDGAAFDALVAAVEQAEDVGSMLAFHERGPVVAELLQQHAGRFGRLEPDVAQLRSRLPHAPGVRRNGGALLTATELSLLSELPSLHTLAEIADARVVSVNTVKAHLRGIYSKLGVRSRREAVASARDAGLL